MSAETIAGGRYQVERVLGEGAMATVVCAQDQELDRLVAVKLLDERLAADETFRARFAREARVAAALSHPNVVGVFDVGEEDGRPFIVMEYIDGRTLADRLRAEGPLPPEEVRRIGLEVAAGLEHAHTQGMIHRDLKPGNLIERPDGTVKIADFGIARAVEGTELTDAGTIVGTAAYLAPEQAEGGEVTPATDVFGVGVVLYELLTGRHPWKVDSLEALAGRGSAPPPELPPSTPPGLQAAILRALESDPSDRPGSAAELAALLDEAPEDATAVMRRPPLRRQARAGGRTWLAALLGALVLGLAALGVALLATDGDGGGGTAKPTTQAQVEPIADGATPAEDARNLADWLRENASG